MRHIYLLLLLIPMLTHAQTDYQWKLSVAGGTMGYVGDLSYKWNFPLDKIEPAASLSLERRLNNSFSIGINGMWGTFYGTDRLENTQGELLTDNPNLARALNFQTEVRDVSLLFYYYTNNGSIFNYDARFYPYFFAGIGGTDFSVSGDLYGGEGNRYYYWSDNSIRNLPEANPLAVEIEQDGEYETDLDELQAEGEDYATQILNIPFGLGFNLRLSPRWDLQLNFVGKYAFSDYLDDVSGKYPEVEGNPVQAYVANPSGIAQTWRGNENQRNDWYFFTGLGLSFRFGEKKVRFEPPTFYINYNSHESDTSKLPIFWGMEELRNQSLLADTTQSFILEKKEIQTIVRTESGAADTTISVEMDTVFMEMPKPQVIQENQIQTIVLDRLGNADTLRSVEIDTLETIVPRPIQIKNVEIRTVRMDSLGSIDTLTSVLQSDTLIQPMLRPMVVEQSEIRLIQLNENGQADTTVSVSSDTIQEVTPEILAMVVEGTDPAVLKKLDEIEAALWDLKRSNSGHQSKIDSIRISITEIQNEKMSEKAELRYLGMQTKLSDLERVVKMQPEEEEERLVLEGPTNVQIPYAIEPISPAKEDSMMRQLQQINSDMQNISQPSASNYDENQALKMQVLESQLYVLESQAKNERVDKEYRRMKRELRRLRLQLAENEGKSTKDTIVMQNLIKAGNDSLQRGYIDSLQTAYFLSLQADLDQLRENEVTEINERIARLEALLIAQQKMQTNTAPSSETNDPNNAILTGIYDKMLQLNTEMELIKRENERLQKEISEKEQPIIVKEEPKPEVDPLTLIMPTLNKERIFFDINKHSLSLDQKSRLDRVAKLLQSYDGLSVVITGFTDKSGNPAYNLVLSQKRANAVKDYLLDQPGVSSQQVVANYKGEDSSSSQGRDANARRVEVDFLRTGK